MEHHYFAVVRVRPSVCNLCQTRTDVTSGENCDLATFWEEDIAARESTNLHQIWHFLWSLCIFELAKAS